MQGVLFQKVERKALLGGCISARTYRRRGIEPCGFRKEVPAERVIGTEALSQELEEQEEQQGAWSRSRRGG